MLAVRLSHSQSVKALLAAKCNANAESQGWSVVQEAVCSGDPEILTAILEVRDLQRHIQRVTHVPQLLQKLIEAPDFYVEMKWEFTSWGKSDDVSSRHDHFPYIVTITCSAAGVSVLPEWRIQGV